MYHASYHNIHRNKTVISQLENMPYVGVLVVDTGGHQAELKSIANK